MTFDEKAETVFEIYKRTLDFDMACVRLDLSTEDIKELKADRNFMLRLAIFDSEEQEKLIQNMRNLTRSKNESIALSATVKLGAMIYKKRFVPEVITIKRDNTSSEDDIVLTDKENEQFAANMNIIFNHEKEYSLND